MIAPEYETLPELTPEQKLAVAVIHRWILDYQKYVEKCRQIASYGRKPYKSDLYKWPDTIDAEFWCMVCGGSQAQLIRYRDYLWQKVEEAYKAAQHKQPILHKRAKNVKAPVNRKRVVSNETTTEAKRAAISEETVYHKRTNPEEKTEQGECVIFCQEPVVKKRATKCKDPFFGKRAVLEKKTAAEERTMIPQKPKAKECAISKKKPTEKERAVEHPDYWDDAIIEVAELLGITRRIKHA